MDQDFDETAYLAANADVAAAVRRGEIDSGSKHYELYGRYEGRPLKLPATEYNSNLKPDWLILPPFNFNHPTVAKYSPEVTGRIILKSMCERLGWPSLAGKRLLDFGCGVRFTRTIVNLELDVGQYAGVDVNPEPIAWLKENVVSPTFRFEHINMRNPMYNPSGDIPPAGTLTDFGFAGFDAACMFSVITHQDPEEAALIFSMLRPVAQRLYFTAIIDNDVDIYTERSEASPRLQSIFSTDAITKLLHGASWKLEKIFEPSLFQQTVFICS